MLWQNIDRAVVFNSTIRWAQAAHAVGANSATLILWRLCSTRGCSVDDRTAPSNTTTQTRGQSTPCHTLSSPVAAGSNPHKWVVVDACTPSPAANPICVTRCGVEEARCGVEEGVDALEHSCCHHLVCPKVTDSQRSTDTISRTATSAVGTTPTGVVAVPLNPTTHTAQHTTDHSSARCETSITSLAGLWARRTSCPHRQTHRPTVPTYS